MALPRYLLSTTNRPVFHFTMDQTRGEFDLSAPYQRGSVWVTAQKVNLIKSLLMGVPVGAVTVAVSDVRRSGPHYRVIDGRQRIEAMRQFADGELAVPGEWFDKRDLADPRFVYSKVTFDDLSQRGRRVFESCTLGAVEFNSSVEYVEKPDGGFTHRTRSDVEALAAEAELYLLINFGGVEQTDADRDRAAAVASR